MQSQPRNITFEWKDSRAMTFPAVMDFARERPTFHEGRRPDGKRFYRLSCEFTDRETIEKMIAFMWGWRCQSLYVNGKRVDWSTAQYPLKCFADRQAAFHKVPHCYGCDIRVPNIFGCRLLGISFTTGSGMFRRGRIVKTRTGPAWEFDKAEIRHDLERSARICRLCPAFDMRRALDGLAALPDRVRVDGRAYTWQHAERLFLNPEPEREPTRYETWEDVTPDPIDDRPIIGVNPHAQALRDVAQNLPAEQARYALLSLCAFE